MSISKKNTLSKNKEFSESEEYLEVSAMGSGPEIEELAGDIPQDKIPFLITYYYHTQDWDEKCALVELLRFEEHSDLPAMMLDYLRAPKEYHDNKEYMLIAKANALGFMGTEYDIIEEYYDNLNLIVRDTSKILAQKGLDYYPLDKAGRDEIVRNEYQAKEEKRYIYKKTPQEQLIFGIEEGSLDRVKIALKNLADVNALIIEGDCKGMSMLMFAISRAVSHRNLDIIHLLLDKGADIHVTRKINPKDDPNKGQTALWWASDLGDETIVRRLLDAGAVPNIPDQHDYTPRLAALYVKHQHIADILQQAESKLAPKAKPQETPKTENPSDKKQIDKKTTDKAVKQSRSQLIIGILVSCLLFSFCVGCFQLKEHLVLEKSRQLLDEAGVVTDAYVVNRDITQNTYTSMSDTRKKTTMNSYSVILRFDTNSVKGKTRQGMTASYKEINPTVGGNTYDRSYIGTTMDIKYLPDDPNIYEILEENGEYTKKRLPLYLAIGMFLLFCFLVFQLRLYYKTGKTW